MDDHSETYGSESKPPQNFWAALLTVKEFISRLGSLVRLTQRDLMDAGVYLREKRD